MVRLYFLWYWIVLFSIFRRSTFPLWFLDLQLVQRQPMYVDVKKDSIAFRLLLRIARDFPKIGGAESA